MNRIFKTLADQTRRQMLQLLHNGPMTARDLADRFEVSKPTMSAHFAVLREADLVDSIKDGKSVVYGLRLSVLEEPQPGFAQLFGIRANAKRGPARTKELSWTPTKQVFRTLYLSTLHPLFLRWAAGCAGWSLSAHRHGSSRCWFCR